MDWWVTQSGQDPVGPVTTELLLKGIDAGKVPIEALVCEVGGQSWRALGEVAPFADAVARQSRARRFDHAERTMVDPEPPLPSGIGASEEPINLLRFDGSGEHTIVDRPPPPSEPPPLARFEEGEDRTIVDIVSRPKA